MTSSLDLSRTRAVLERGIDLGLHLGGQLFVSLGGASAELALGEKAPGEPMTSDTLMIWLSSSKPVAAVALAQLWERGLLDLDDPVACFVPEFGVHGKERITLRHVLTHTAGIRMLSVGWPEASWDEIVAHICAARPEPRTVPGQQAGYHLAASWFLLGEVIRRIDSRPYSRYVREEVFLPLGMHDSWVGMPRERFLAYDGRIGRMWGTEGKRLLGRPWHKEPHVVGCSPGGNGYGPIRDLGRFYEMLLGRGSLDGTRILTPQSVEALTTPHRVGMLDQTFKHKLDWGLGFIVDSKHYGAELEPYGYGKKASRRTFGHSGYQSSAGFADPEHGLVAAFVVNGNPGEPRHTERFREICDALYDDLGLD